jgi:hypothetical protein
MSSPSKETESKEEDSSKEPETATTTTTATDEQPKKKRTADRQITKDDDDDDEGDDDNNNEAAASKIFGTPFEKATPEVMAQRRILKVKRPAAPGAGVSDGTATTTTAGESTEETTTSTTKSSNPFAATKLTTESSSSGTGEQPKKVFGSGLAMGFGAAAAAAGGATGFGAAAAAKNNTSGGFGSSSGFSGFGAAAYKNGSGFGAFGSSSTSSSTLTSKPLFGTTSGSSGTTGFPFSAGAKKDGGADASSSPAAASTTPAVKLPDHVDLKTGEEDEVNVLELRGKSFKWVLEDESAGADKKSSDGDSGDADATKSSSEAAAAHPSVAPSSAFDKTKPTDSTGDSDKKSDSKAGDITSGTSEPQHKWTELGIGPIKLLEKPGETATTKRVRLVQRRESSPNGPATKVILNIPVWKESTCKKNADKHVSVTTITETGAAETYLFKFKLPEEALQFRAKVTSAIETAKSVVGK